MKFTGIMRLSLPVAVLMAGMVAGAQSTTTTTSTQTSAMKPATVGERKENQQDRIANGVQNGSLTAGETSNLESKEAAINQETRADRAANGGKLTSAEKQQINGQQNQLSKQIYTDKHNAASQHYGNNEVDRRRENQQDRIAQGIRSGQMTAGEAAKVENQERGINQQVHADRAANGGKLTPAERQQINKEQNHESKNIYNKKHNGKTQHGH